MTTSTATAEAQKAIDDRGLLAASDVLVLRALELIGKRIVRVDRSRFRRMGVLEFHEAHVLWQPEEEMLEKSLATAWTFVEQVVREHARADIDSRQVVLILDRYVRDLVQGMRAHDVTELRYRLEAFT